MTKTLGLLPSCDTVVAERHWLLGPVGQTRESGAAEASNFEELCAQLDAIDPDFADHEVISFNHWACGWIEEMAVRPGSRAAEIQAGLKAELEDNPILNYDLYQAYTEEAESPLHDEPTLTDLNPDLPETFTHDR